jgi:hypothetical protein
VEVLHVFVPTPIVAENQARSDAYHHPAGWVVMVASVVACGFWFIVPLR